MAITENSDGFIHKGIPLVKWQERREGATAGVESASMAYEAMEPVWHLINTMIAGTVAMRAAGEAFMPRHEYESESTYRERLETAVFDNYLLQTLEILVGKAFQEPPALNDDVPEPLKDLLDDADGAGNNWVNVARDWFRDAVAKGFSHLWIDYSDVRPKADGSPRTLEDDAKENLRPFWKVVKPENVRFLDGMFIDGRFYLTMVRMHECTLERDGWGQVLVERIRVLEPGAWSLYRKVQTKRNSKPKWVWEDGGSYNLSFIPFLTYYTSKSGLQEAKPPLEDLAHLNKRHWQSSSDQEASLTVARFPILAVSGVSGDDKDGEGVKLGPKRWLSTPDPTSKIYYVEHTGAALEAGLKHLDRLEQRMATYGAEFLREQADRASASGRQMDGAEQTSLLGCWCFDFKDALEKALWVTGQWMKLGNETGTVAFKLEPSTDLSDQYELATLTAARARGDISRLAFMTELKRRHLLPPEYDIMADEDQIGEEVNTLGSLGKFLPGEETKVGMGEGSVGLPGQPAKGKAKRDEKEKGEKMSKERDPKD